MKYVANRLGGTHLGVGRTEKEQRTSELLDQAMGAAVILDKPAVLFEVLAIGQAIAMCDDASRLIKRVRGLV